MVTIHLREMTAEKKFGLYEATTPEGEVLVSSKREPVFAVCRVLAGRGLSGGVAFYSPGSDRPRLIVRDLERAAGYRVKETAQVGPKLEKWAPYSGPERVAPKGERPQLTNGLQMFLPQSSEVPFDR